MRFSAAALIIAYCALAAAAPANIAAPQAGSIVDRAGNKPENGNLWGRNDRQILDGSYTPTCSVSNGIGTVTARCSVTNLGGGKVSGDCTARGKRMTVICSVTELGGGKVRAQCSGRDLPDGAVSAVCSL
jgi:hypothetical protein